MKKKLAACVGTTAFALAGFGVLATPAGAHHQHYIDTPQDLRITLPCERPGPPSTMHIRHEKFHLNPGQANNAVHVHHYGQNSCTNPLPSGPNR